MIGIKLLGIVIKTFIFSWNYSMILLLFYHTALTLSYNFPTSELSPSFQFEFCLS